MVVTSTAPDSGIFYSSDVFTWTSTASDGGAFFSSDTPTSTVDSHPSNHCLPTAHLDNPLNPNVAPPIDAVPSFVDYSTPPIALPEVAGLAFDRGTPFEMPNLTSVGKDMPMGLSSVLTKRAVPRIASNPGPILGAVESFWVSFLRCSCQSSTVCAEVPGPTIWKREIFRTLAVVVATRMVHLQSLVLMTFQSPRAMAWILSILLALRIGKTVSLKKVCMLPETV